MLRFDELDELAAILGEEPEAKKKKRTISKQALAKALARIKDGKSRSLKEYCRFRSDPDDYERYDNSRTARWVVREISEFTGTASELPKPIAEVNGVRFLDAPVGPVERLKVPGYTVERLSPGQIRLKKSQPVKPKKSKRRQ